MVKTAVAEGPQRDLNGCMNELTILNRNFRLLLSSALPILGKELV